MPKHPLTRVSTKDGYLCTDDGKPCQKIFTEKVLTYTTKCDILRVRKATKAIQFILQKGGCSMKNPNSKLELRAELCKALKKNFHMFGYDMEDEVKDLCVTLRNCIRVCDCNGEKDICIIEVKDGTTVLHVARKHDDNRIEEYYEDLYHINYAYAGSKNDYFMECANGIIFCMEKERGNIK